MLKLRLQLFFPNVSLCDEDCISKGVDLKTMESICSCPFNDFSQNSVVSNIFEFTGPLGELYSFISNSNIDVLFCIKQIFELNYIKRCIGGFTIILLFLVHNSSILLYFLISKNKFKIFIYKLQNTYLRILRTNSNNEPPKKKEKKNKKEKGKEIKAYKSQLYYEPFSTTTSFKKIDRKKNNQDTGINKNKISKYDNQIIVTNINSEKNELNDNNLPEVSTINDNINKTDFDEYLATDPNEMDFEKALEKDKRKFCEYFWELLKEKQLIINSFFINDNMKPKSIKIMLFLLNFMFFLLINGLLFGEDYLVDLYNSGKDENFFSFISRSITNFVYLFVIIQLLNEIVDCLFVEEKKLKKIFILGKNDIKKIQNEILLLIKKIEKSHIIFFIISYLIFIFTWIYISCFNDIYYYSRKEWMKSSIFFFIIFQILYIIICLGETIVRFLSIRFKSEKLFKLSKIIGSL